MQTHIGWLWIVGFFGLLAAANAQTALRPVANTQFDGTYAFVSSTKVNETSRDFKNRELQCPDRSAGALTILNGAARYMGSGGREFEGTVASSGELAMRSSAPGIKSRPPSEVMINGKIDANGTIRARRVTYRCSHDLIWQKSK